MNNPLEPTRPVERRNGGLVLVMYGQDDLPMELIVPDTKHNMQFVVWVRQHDRK